MKLRIPLFKQKGRPTCGPTALRMILSYLGKNISQEDLEKLIGYKEGKGTSSIKLALTAKKLGYDVELRSIHINPLKENFEMDYYKQYMDEDIDTLNKLTEEARKLGVKLTEESIELNNLLSYVNKKIIPLVVIDWNIIRPKYKGFMGHYVAIAGYDSKFVYVNNSAGKKGMRLQPILRSVFDKARKSKGTDEDIILITKS